MRNLESRDWKAASLLVRGPLCFLYNISLLVVISCFIFFVFLAILLIMDCYQEKNKIWNSLSSLSSAMFLVRETWTVCHQLYSIQLFVSYRCAPPAASWCQRGVPRWSRLVGLQLVINSAYRYLEPFRRNSRVWRTDRHCHNKGRTLQSSAAKNYTLAYTTCAKINF